MANIIINGQITNLPINVVEFEDTPEYQALEALATEGITNIFSDTTVPTPTGNVVYRAIKRTSETPPVDFTLKNAAGGNVTVSVGNDGEGVSYWDATKYKEVHIVYDFANDTHTIDGILVARSTAGIGELVGNVWDLEVQPNVTKTITENTVVSVKGVAGLDGVLVVNGSGHNITIAGVEITTAATGKTMIAVFHDGTNILVVGNTPASGEVSEDVFSCEGLMNEAADDIYPASTSYELLNNNPDTIISKAGTVKNAKMWIETPETIDYIWIKVLRGNTLLSLSKIYGNTLTATSVNKFPITETNVEAGDWYTMGIVETGVGGNATRWRDRGLGNVVKLGAGAVDETTFASLDWVSFANNSVVEVFIQLLGVSS